MRYEYMKTEMEKFNNGEDNNEAVASGDVLGQQEFERSSSPYRLPESYKVGELEISVEALRTLELPGLEKDPAVLALSEEVRGELGATFADMAETAYLAESGEVSPDAKKAARVATAANALFASPDEEESAVDEATERQIKEARTDSKEVGTGVRFVDWVNTKGKAIVRAALVAASISAIPQAALAGGRDFGGIFDRAVAQRVESGVRVKRSVEHINVQQERIRIDIERLEREKDILLQRAEGRAGLGEVQNQTESNARLIQLDSRYRADKMSLDAKRMELESRHAAKPNPSAAEAARHRSQLMQIDAQEIRLDGNYQAQRARAEGRSAVQSGRIGNEMLDVGARIRRIDIEIQHLATELRRLNAERTNVLIEGGLRGFRR